MQQCYVEIADGMDDLDSLLADLVSRTDYLACPHPAPCEEHGLCFGIVIPPDGDATASVVVVGAPAELAQPNDQRLVKQASLSQVFDESRHRLVNAVNACLVGPFKVVVGVPSA